MTSEGRILDILSVNTGVENVSPKISMSKPLRVRYLFVPLGCQSVCTQLIREKHIIFRIKKKTYSDLYMKKQEQTKNPTRISFAIHCSVVIIHNISKQ
jgi:hypothetical protein